MDMDPIEETTAYRAYMRERNKLQKLIDAEPKEKKEDESKHLIYITQADVEALEFTDE